MDIKLNNLINEYIKKYDLNSLDITSNARELVLMLLSHIKGVSVTDIKLGMAEVNESDIFTLDNMLKSIAIDKVPPQYITNKVYIYNEEYYVKPGILIPRPDTETLIEESIKVIHKYRYNTLLDMCTGSGVVAISTVKNSGIKKADMVDVSDICIEVANKNIVLNNVEDKCNTICSNMFYELYKTDNKYDIIVSNPPYLTNNEMEELSEFVKNEPALALFGGDSGLDMYNVIYNEAKNFLNDGGSILVEIGFKQARDVLDIIAKHKEYYDVQVIKDINKKDRVISCRFQKI